LNGAVGGRSTHFNPHCAWPAATRPRGSLPREFHFARKGPAVVCRPRGPILRNGRGSGALGAQGDVMPPTPPVPILLGRRPLLGRADWGAERRQKLWVKH